MLAPVPPLSRETAIMKVGMAEDAWNSRDPQGFRWRIAKIAAGEIARSSSLAARKSYAQASSILCFAKISSTRLNAFSAAASGAIPPVMISVQPVLQTCSFCT
jgi:uncharacterized protein DUF1348